VAQDLQNVDLACDPFNVCRLDYFVLLQGLNCHLLVGGNVDAQPYFPESALADAFACLTMELPTRYCPMMNSVLVVVLMSRRNKYCNVIFIASYYNHQKMHFA
jgi:hypothetical protein